MSTSRLTTEIFIARSNKKHDFKYDYSISIYKSSLDKLKIICHNHGVFEQRAAHHMNGMGCRMCAADNLSALHASSAESVLEKFKTTHGDTYDYSLFSYKNSTTKVKIICRTHGIFEQYPYTHIIGNGCKKCSVITTAEKRKSCIEDFISKALLIHGDKYIYDDVVYLYAKSKVKIRCKAHGVFMQSANAHLGGHGCKKCGLDSAFNKNTANNSYHGYSRSNYVNIAKEKNNNKSNLYIAKIASFDGSEIFYKVGISLYGVKRRFSKIKEYKIISYVEFNMSAELAWNMERSIHREINGLKYTPLISFGGHTECFCYIPLCIYKKAKLISDLIKSKGCLYDGYILK